MQIKIIHSPSEISEVTKLPILLRLQHSKFLECGTFSVEIAEKVLTHGPECNMLMVKKIYYIAGMCCFRCKSDILEAEMIN